MRLLVAQIDRWFGEPAPPERLAMFRILLGTFTLAYLLIRLPVFLALADGRPSRFEPVGLLSVLTGPLPGPLVILLVVGALVAAAAFALGLGFRFSGPALAVIMLVLGTYRSSWGQLLHFENLLVLHLLVVGLSPAAHVWSADARQHWEHPTTSSRYGWPLRLAATITVITYVIAGVAKLRYGGIDWMLGDTLQNHVAYSATRLDLLGGDAAPLADPLVRQGWLFPPLATATVVIELAAPLALFGPRLRRLWVVSAWLMHAGILALMYVLFPYPLFGLAFAPFYNLERLAPGQAGRPAPRSGPVLQIPPLGPERLP